MEITKVTGTKLRILCSALFLIVGANSVKGQYQFSLNDLIALCKLKSDDFKTFVINKGYIYQPEKSNDKDDFKLEKYTSDSISLYAYNISWSEYKKEPGVLIELKTTDKQYFKNFESLLKKNGWTIDKKVLNDRIEGRPPPY